MKRFLLRLAIVALLTTSTMEASAQSSLEQARILFDAGVQAYTAGRYNEAVESFKEAYTLSDKPQALFSLAQAERRLYLVSQDPQHLRSAIDHFRKYLEVVGERGRRSDAAEALEQLEVLAAREVKPADAGEATSGVAMGRILISTTTPGATISIDGAKAAESPALEVVKPGKHIVRVSAPGYISEEREITAIEKTLVPLEVTLREEPSYLSLTTRDGASIAIDGRVYGEAPIRNRIELRQGKHSVRVSLAGYYSRRTAIELEPGKTNSIDVRLDLTRQRIVSYVVLGAAGATFLAAGIQGVVALQQESAGQDILQKTKNGNINQTQLDEYNASVVARDGLRNSSLLTLVGAGVLGVAGAIMYVSDAQRTAGESAPNRDNVGFSVTLTPSIAGFDVIGRF